IGPSVGETFEGCAGLGDGIQHIEQVAGAAGEPVESGDDQDIARRERSDELGEFGPVGLGPRDFLSPDPFGAGSFEGFELCTQILVAGADAGIADDHDRSSQSLQGRARAASMPTIRATMPTLAPAALRPGLVPAAVIAQNSRAKPNTAKANSKVVTVI